MGILLSSYWAFRSVVSLKYIIDELCIKMKFEHDKLACYVSYVKYHWKF